MIIADYQDRLTSTRSTKNAFLVRSYCRRSYFIAVVVFVAIGGCSGDSPIESVDSARFQGPILPVGDSRLPTITMTDSEFETWRKARNQAGERHPQLKGESILANLPPRVGMPSAYTPVLCISLPGREEHLVSRSLIIKLDDESYQESLSELHLFPEITWLWYRWETQGNPEYIRQVFEDWQVPAASLQPICQLPLLRGIQFDGGIFDKQAIEIISSHPNVRNLTLGRCVIKPDDFGELRELRSLERLIVTTGASPTWFKTLAKLPKLRVFSIVGATLGEVDLAQETDSETQAAIKSLNGRLTEFHATHTYNTIIHADFAKALFEVESLQILKVAVGSGMDVESLEPLVSMPNLVDLEFEIRSPDFETYREQGEEIINAAQHAVFLRRNASQAMQSQSP